ncbi:hypothetical protein E3N88_13435 [Mikania micrantha]|uniref:HMA domain-containing protein n=1 Tax=Mikania micrantha TaxID=192012 RepID=A0A5N6PB89_9ASTR|nr:hypothetical protein E3N88_13435 [Mikania micrantha]
MEEVDETESVHQGKIRANLRGDDGELVNREGNKETRGPLMTGRMVYLRSHSNSIGPSGQPSLSVTDTVVDIDFTTQHLFLFFILHEKVTVMILNVDLKCSCCYKKVRKLLCKIPEIRDQVFDEEKNKVMITVVCCDPEKMRDKLCCKGGKAIQSIEILQPKPPSPMPKPHPPKIDPMPDPQPQAKLPVPEPIPAPKPVKMPDPQPKPPQPQPVKMPEPMPIDPFCPPVSVCCQECYEGRGGGPCHYWYGRPPPGPCYDYGYQYAGNRPPCYVSRCDYFSEENPQGCSVMVSVFGMMNKVIGVIEVNSSKDKGYETTVKDVFYDEVKNTKVFIIIK